MGVDQGEFTIAGEGRVHRAAAEMNYSAAK
jgi:hypothetical protein